VAPIFKESKLPFITGLRLLKKGKILTFTSITVWELIINKEVFKGKIIKKLSNNPNKNRDNKCIGGKIIKELSNNVNKSSSIKSTGEVNT